MSNAKGRAALGRLAIKYTEQQYEVTTVDVMFMKKLCDFIFNS